MATDFFSFTGIQNEVKLRLGNRSDIAARIPDWIYAVQLYMAKSELEFPFLEIESQIITLNPNQPDYNVEALGLDDIIGIRLWRNETNNQRLRRFPFREFRSLATQSSGPPVRWTRRGNVLFVDPVPTVATATLMDYRRQPQRGQLEFDKEWHETIITAATAMGWRALDNHTKAQQVFGQLPAIVQLRLQQPLSQAEWEAMWSDGPSVALEGVY